MSRGDIMRRTLVVAGALGTAIVLLAASAAVAAPGGVTDSDTLSELAEARAATAKYHDVEAALADGYLPLSPFIPGMGVHYVNFSLFEDAGFVLEEPEILLYAPVGNSGKLKLVGVEYGGAVVAPDGFTGTDDVWDLHPAACHYTDGSESPCASPADSDERLILTVWHPDLWVVHVWLWLGNPDGIFAGFNPTLE